MTATIVTAIVLTALACILLCSGLLLGREKKALGSSHCGHHRRQTTRPAAPEDTKTN